MNLVPVQIDFTKIEISDVESDESLESKISQLEHQRDAMRKRLDSAVEASKKGSTLLSSSREFCEREDRHNQLMMQLQERELERLKREMQTWQDPEKVKEAQDIIDRLAAANDAPQKAPDVGDRVRTSDKELKRMYKKLMNAIHPDRVKNKRLNDLVPLATSMYDRGDFIGLSNLYDSVIESSGKIKSIRERARKFLTSLLNSLKAELTSLNSKIADTESLLATHVYHISQMAGQEAAVNFAIQQMNAAIRELEQRLNPQPSFYIRTSFGSSTFY